MSSSDWFSDSRPAASKLWSSANHPNPHAPRSNTSLPTSDQTSTPTSPIRSASSIRHSRSNAPSPSSAAGSANQTIRDADAAQHYFDARDALLAEYQNLDPVLRELLPSPEGFVNPSQAKEVDEPRSDFEDTPQIRRRVLRVKARLDQINGSTSHAPAPQVHPPETAGSTHLPYPLHDGPPSVHPGKGNINSSGVVHNEHRLPVPDLSASMSNEYQEYHIPLEELAKAMPREPGSPTHSQGTGRPRHFPTHSAGYPKMPRGVPRPTMPSDDDSDILENKYFGREGRFAGRPRQFQGHRRRTGPYNGPPSLVSPSTQTDDGFEADTDTIPSATRARISHNHGRIHMGGWDRGFATGKLRGNALFIEDLRDSVHWRLLILGLAFVMYGLFACEKWTDGCLNVLLGLNFLGQAEK